MLTDAAVFGDHALRQDGPDEARPFLDAKVAIAASLSRFEFARLCKKWKLDWSLARARPQF